jgi:hypothetical protein
MKVKKSLKEQLQPLYENMRFLNLIFERKDTPYIKFLIQNKKDPLIIREEILKMGGTKDQFNKLGFWMNWINEGQYINPDDPYYADYGDQPEIDVNPDADDLSDSPTAEESQQSYEFPLYILVWVHTNDGGRKPKMLKAKDYSEMIDYTMFQNAIGDPIKDFNEAKEKFLNLGGQESELVNMQ